MKDTQVLSIPVTKELYEELRKDAYLTRKSMSSIIRELLAEKYNKQN